MKIALITDTHCGARNDNSNFNEYFLKFHEHVFFPYLVKHPEIKHIIHLGDVFDRRKYINFNTLSSWRERVFNRLQASGREIHIILGNHDTYHKNSNTINSVEQLLKDSYKDWKVYSKPCTINLGDMDICLLPWICEENYQDSIKEIQDTKAQICMGHLELQGFDVFAGHPHAEGMSPTLFQKFDQVFSGRFHHKSNKDNIHYLGSPYPIYWHDWGDRRGFHVFDTNTRELEFIENPLQIFHKLYYNDTNESFESIMSKDFSLYTGMFVRVIVQKKTNPYWFDQFIEGLQKANPCDINVVEGSFEDSEETEEEAIDETKDTLTILMEYVDSIQVEHNKEELKQVLCDLYTEALNTNDQVQNN